MAKQDTKTQRQTALSLYREGRTPKDIAKALGISPATVRSWKARDCWDNPGQLLQQKLQRVATHKQADATLHALMVQDTDSNPNLTEKERAFCLHYIRTYNAASSCVRAGYSTNWTAQAGYDLLHRPHIQAELQRLKQLRSAAMLAGAEDVVEKYMHIAFADLSDFVQWGRATLDVMGPLGPLTVEDPDTGETVPLTKEVNDVRFLESTAVDGTLIAEVKLGKDGASLKLADRMKALEWLSKYFELHPSDTHRREYDKRKLELELLRTQASLPDSAPHAPPDDGFLAALNTQAGQMWPEGFVGDVPHAPGLKAESEADAPQASEASP